MALDIFEDEEFKKQPRSVREDVVRNYAKQEIAADPEFQTLPPEERRGILQRYFKDNLPEAVEEKPWQPSALEAYPELLKTPMADAFRDIPSETVTGIIEEERKKPLAARVGELAQWGMITGPKTFMGKMPVTPPPKIPAINLLKPKITGIKGQAPRGVPIPRFFPPEPEILTAKELAMRKVPIPDLTAKEKTAIIRQAEREGGGYIVGKKPNLGSETVKTTLFPGMEKKVKLAPADVPKTPLMPQRVGPSISAGGSLRPDIGKSQFEIIQEEMAQAKGKPQYAGPREEFISTPEGTIIPPEGVAPLKLGDPNLSAFEQAKKQLGTVTGEPPIPPKGKQPKPKKTIPPVSLGETSQLPPVPKFAKKAPDRAPEWVYEQKEPIVYQYEGYDPNVKLHAYTAQIQGGEALSHNNSSVFITKNRLKSGMVKPEDKIIGGPFATETKAALQPSPIIKTPKPTTSKKVWTTVSRKQAAEEATIVREKMQLRQKIEREKLISEGKLFNPSTGKWETGMAAEKPVITKQSTSKAKTKAAWDKITSGAEKGTATGKEATLPAKLPAITKEPWEMTKQEYIKPPYTSPAMHKYGVQKALSEGKPVPPEVLKDYPDLVKTSKGTEEGKARLSTLIGLGAGATGAAVLPKILTPTLPHTETEER